MFPAFLTLRRLCLASVAKRFSRLIGVNAPRSGIETQGPCPCELRPCRCRPGKARALWAPIDQLYNALAATLGTHYVNDSNKVSRTSQVLMSSSPEMAFGGSPYVSPRRVP
jgi:hypothetical protein